MFLSIFVIVFVVALLSERYLSFKKSNASDNNSGVVVLLRIGALLAFLGILTWPIITHPILFSFECSCFATNNLEPGIDASKSGYYDKRIFNPNVVKWRRDDSYMRQNISNLRTGRVKFFEIENHKNSDLTGLKYFQFYLLDNGSVECTLTKNFGFNWYDNKNLKSDQCLALRVISRPESKYIISVHGDLITQNATTVLMDVASQEVIRIYKSILIEQLFGGYQMCPSIYRNGHVYSGHSQFTEIVFKDRYGKTLYDTEPSKDR